MSGHDPTDLSAEAARLDARTHREQVTSAEEASDVKWLMGSTQGRRIVWRLLELAGVWRSSFTPNALQTAFNEGHRNYGISTLAIIMEHCPELYPVMVREHGSSRGSGGNGDSRNVKRRRPANASSGVAGRDFADGADGS